MKKQFYLSLWMCIFALLAACVDDKLEPETPQNGGRTVLVYVAADNSLSSFASADLAEMKTGMAKVKDDAGVHLLVYIDNGQSARLLELKNVGGTVTETEVRNYGQRNSVGVSETKEVFAEVFQNPQYRADSYGLVYWSHGEGWLPYPLRAGTRWIGQDIGDGTDHRMNISEFAEILSTAPHFDFILFDACFMQSIEAAYELRSYTDYLIGSPTEIPGPGAPYDEVVPAMFTADDAAVSMATAYYSPYAARYNPNVDVSNWNWTGGVSVSVLRTDRLEQLAQATKRAMTESVDNAWLRSGVVFDYDKRRSSSSSRVGYYDFAGMMEQVATDAAYDEWKKAFDDAVVYWTTTAENYSSYVGRFSMEGATGVSCYIPSAQNTPTDNAYRSTSWYESVGFRW
ncbi:clostripain-related cysteine peptidase [uncultured Bacteroides sp.]|uniref:clostripain-related cysteine peptidase n=1 Tax=uncultured Bacteroides sp. TaxID=162156 RepID=UPI0026184A18|nr:clostripain-related cysteine peptidase [uncultured Bacteroides sp.]